jgi:hypothetical protein
VQVAAVEVPVNDLLQMRPPEAILSGIMVIIDLNKVFKMVLYAAVIIRILRVSWAINSGRKRLALSFSRISCHHNVEGETKP